MLAADMATLPKSMRDGVKRFFNANRGWLTRILQAGLDDGTISFEESPAVVADYIVSTLEGAMLIARTYKQNERFEATAARLLAEL